MLRLLLMILLVVLVGGCGEVPYEEDDSAEPSTGGDGCPDLPVEPMHLEGSLGFASRCGTVELESLVGFWADHNSQPVEISEDLVVDGVDRLCVQSEGVLAQVLQSGSGSKAVSYYHTAPGLFAWDVFTRVSTCGQGLVGHWVAEWVDDAGDWTVLHRELFVYADGTFLLAFLEVVDDSSIEWVEAGNWGSVQDDRYAGISLEGSSVGTLWLDADALFASAKHLRRPE